MNLRLSLLLVVLLSSAALATDPFLTLERSLPSPAAELRPESVCDVTAVTGTLTLAHAVERALCANPATRAAWLTARLRAAELGQAQSAYRPELSLDVRLGHSGDDLLPTDRGAWSLESGVWG